MCDYAGIVRNEKHLGRAQRRIELLPAEADERWQKFRINRDFIELRNLITVADLIVRSALSRRESRGLHCMREYPESDPALNGGNTLLAVRNQPPPVDNALPENQETAAYAGSLSSSAYRYRYTCAAFRPHHCQRSAISKNTLPERRTRWTHPRKDSIIFSFMRIAIPKETLPGERRVAASPESVRKLCALGYEVSVGQGAGKAANFSDAAYQEQGAEIASDVKALWQKGDIVLKVRPPQLSEVDLMKQGATLISFIAPAQNPELLEKFKSRKINALAVDQIPRITRAQKLDALSSMANIAGYRAVVEAAQHFGRFLGGQSTAAGRIPPAKVLIIGAGVAGLAAIGAARGLGAVVRAFDTRPEVAQQIESMGADFLTVSIEEEASGGGGYAKQMSDAFLEAELALFREQAEEVDIVITTALIPGKPAPRLITEDIVKCFKPGSVIVDLAAEQGGNCELTEADKVVVKHDVTIIGYTNLPSRMASQSSRLYAGNMQNFMTDLTPEKNGVPVLDVEDVVTRNALVSKDGEILWPPPPLETPAPPKPAASEPLQKKPEISPKRKLLSTLVVAAVGATALFGLGQVAPPDFMAHFTVFVLACFVGWQVIWNVTPALHTPLMSVTNAISGIIIIGALLQTSEQVNAEVLTLALIAALIAMINVAGGFLVTQRMLNMFRREDPKENK